MCHTDDGGMEEANGWSMLSRLVFPRKNQRLGSTFWRASGSSSPGQVHVLSKSVHMIVFSHEDIVVSSHNGKTLSTCYTSATSGQNQNKVITARTLESERFIRLNSLQCHRLAYDDGTNSSSSRSADRCQAQQQ